MDAKSLRLKNYAQDQNGNILQVVGIKEDNINYFVVDRSKYPLQDGWQAEPIPLTEQWLFDFGFEKKRYTYKKGVLELESDSEQHPKGRTYFNSWELIEEFPIYVHQLQNLYFALTGEELNKNP